MTDEKLTAAARRLRRILARHGDAWVDLTMVDGHKWYRTVLKIGYRRVMLDMIGITPNTTQIDYRLIGLNWMLVGRYDRVRLETDEKDVVTFTEDREGAFIEDVAILRLQYPGQ